MPKIGYTPIGGIQRYKNSSTNTARIRKRIGIDDYKNNEFVSQLLDQNVDFVVSELTAWLIRAEMEKGENKP